MSKPVNKTAIGAFAVTTALLLFACVIFFGNFSFGERSSLYVIYLEDSVNGLDIGSAVKFKGVKVGSVRAIDMRLDGQHPSALAVPVIIEINNVPGDETAKYNGERLNVLIQQGLRARTQFTSVVTGLLYIDLDFLPETPIIFRGNRAVIDLQEIPTVTSNSGQMMRAVSAILQDLSTVNFSALSAQLRSAIARVETSLGEIEFGKINDNVVRLTDSAAGIVGDPELKAVVANANRLLKDLDEISDNISGQIDPVSSEIKTSLTALRSTLDEIDSALGDFRALISPERGGTVEQELSGALVQIDEAARAVRALAEYLHIALAAPSDGNSRSHGNAIK